MINVSSQKCNSNVQNVNSKNIHYVYKLLRDGPLENLGGGGAGDVQKTKFAQGKI